MQWMLKILGEVEGQSILEAVKSGINRTLLSVIAAQFLAREMGNQEKDDQKKQKRFLKKQRTLLRKLSQIMLLFLVIYLMS